MSGIMSSGLYPPQWIYVTRRFQTLQRELAIVDTSDDLSKLHGVVRSLNRAYRDQSTLDHFTVGGSWGKETAIRPPSDIDVYFVLPDEVFHEFAGRAGNVQSHLLQEVRTALLTTYPNTRIRGDGQVVVVAFNSITIEVVPAFHREGGGAIICDTNDGGCWKSVNPVGEIRLLSEADIRFNGNVRKLTRILKQWKRHCNVPIKSFHIEFLVQEALSQINYAKMNEFWFDWLVRDVFLHIWIRAGGSFDMPGGFGERIDLGSDWETRAYTAYNRAVAACDYERDNRNLQAGDEWREIFGAAIPRLVI